MYESGSRAQGRSIDNFLSATDGPVLFAAPDQPFEYVWIIDSWCDQSIDPVSPDFIIDNLAFHMTALRPKNQSQFFSVRVILVETPPCMKTFSFNVEIVNADQEKSVVKRSSKAFSRINAYETFTLIPSRKLTEKDGFLKDGALTLKFSYTPISLRQRHSGEQKTQTRKATKSSSMVFTSCEIPIVPMESQFSGLKNQGATCYMNSILQVLYHIPAFRRIVYSMPTTGTEDIEKSVPLNLQALFCKMQFTKNVCSTTDLTDSFGWNKSYATKQQDVVEFERELISNLEEKLKETEFAGHISSLFTGKIKTFIKCKNVDVTHTIVEDFDNLPLVVRGCRNLQESLQNELEPQELTGDEKYKTEEYGFQDAVMGTEFLSFPSILMIQLRRFERDYEHNRNVKINDKFEYPKEIDLDPYLSTSSDHSKNNIYVLFAVLVHSGSITSGHYYSYIRPTYENDQWYKFDDTIVTQVNEDQVISNNFGGPITSNSQTEKNFSAYMLMYVRKEDVTSIYEPVTDESVPLHIREWVSTSDERKKSEVPPDYIDIRLNNENSIRSNAMKWTTGFDNRATAVFLHLSSDETIHALYEKSAEIMHLPLSQIRIWECGPYSVPDMPMADTDTILSEKFIKTGSIFVQCKPDGEKVEIAPDERAIFIKFFFSGHSAAIQYIGAKIVKDNDYVSNLFPYVNELVHLPEATPLIVFQETIQHTAQLISDPQNTTYEEVGILLIFQISPGIEAPDPYFEAVIPSSPVRPNILNPKSLPIVSYYDLNPSLAPTTVDQYMDHKLRTLEAVMFDHDDPTNDVAIIRFPANLSWPALKRLISIAVHRDYEPENDSMRIYKRDTTTGGPSKYPISMKFPPSMRAALAGSAPSKGERSHLFFSIIQGIPESMMSSMANYNVQYSENAFTITRSSRLLIKKGSTPRQVAYEMQNRGLLPQSDSIRVLQVVGNRIISELDFEESIITNYETTLRFEMIPIEQRDYDEEVHIMFPVSHGYIDSHDIPHFVTDPFLYMCSKTETLGDIRDPLLEWAEVPADQLNFTVLMKLVNEKTAVTVSNDTKMIDIISNGAQIFIWEPRLENVKRGKARVTFVDHPPPRELEQPVKIFN